MAQRDVPTNSKLPGEHSAAPTKTDNQLLLWMSSENCAVRRPRLTNEEISKLCVVCTSCGDQLNHHKKKSLCIHRVLKVISCKRCYTYYGDGSFQKDESGMDEYCSWCAEGGNLVLCDTCSRVFCKKCIRRNMSRRELTRIESLDEWHCYVCDPDPLVPLVNYANMIVDYSQELQKQASSSSSSSGVSTKLREADVKKLALQKVAEVQRSISELAESGGGEGFLASMSKLLRDHARSLSHIALSAEECQKRQLKLKKRGESKDVKEDCNDSSASVDSQNSNAKRQTRNRRLLVLDSEYCHIVESDEDEQKAGPKQNKQAREGEDAEAELSTREADSTAKDVTGSDNQEVTREQDKQARGKNESDSEAVTNGPAVNPTDGSITKENGTDFEDGVNGFEVSSVVERILDDGSDDDASSNIRRSARKLTGAAIEKCLENVPEEEEKRNGTEVSAAVEKALDDGSGNEARSGISSPARSVVDAIVEENSEDLEASKEKGKRHKPSKNLKAPPVLSLGDEFSPLVETGESENESESLLAGMLDVMEIVPETPPMNEEREKSDNSDHSEGTGKASLVNETLARLKKEPKSPDGDQLEGTGEASALHETPLSIKEEPEDVDSDQADGVGKASAEDHEGAADVAPGCSTSHDTSGDRLTGECQTDVVQANRSGSPSSVDEANRLTESMPSSEEGEHENLKTPQKGTGSQPKKRSPLSKSTKAHLALMRSLRYSSQSSSDDEMDDPLTSTPRALKHRTPRKRRRKSSSASPALSAEAVERYLEKAAEEYGDPMLKMSARVELERLPIDPSLIAAATAKTKHRKPALGDSDDEEDKEIARLLAPVKMPTKAKGTSESEGEARTQGTSKKPKKKLHKSKAAASDGSSSDFGGCSPQEENDVNKEDADLSSTMMEPKLNDDAFKDALLQGILRSDSEEASEGEPSDLPKKRKKEKPDQDKETKKAEPEADESAPKEEACKAEEDSEMGSDDDGGEKQKAKKRSKYDKLLRKNPLASSGESESDEKEEEEEEKMTKKPQPCAQPQKAGASRKRKIVYSDEDDSGDKKASSDCVSIDGSSSDESSGFTPARKKKSKKAAKAPASDDSDFAEKKSKKGASSSSDVNKRKKKRKRIKMACSTAEEDDDDDDSSVEVLNASQDADGKGRRNIRKLISDKKLTQETKAAAQAEEERKKRIAERQKLYNEALGTGPSEADLTVKQLVLEIDLKTKEPLVQVDKDLVKFMKPHQVNGVKFMYDCLIESVEMLKKDPDKGSGCILAHCMGLGKTFQVISFLHTLMTHEVAGPLLRTALVVCPYNTVLNWANEFERWIDDNGLKMKVYETSSIRVNDVRLEVLERWHRRGGVAIIGYDMFRRLVNTPGRGKKKTMQEKFRKLLLDPGPKLVVCDEGHVLKNESTGLSKAMSQLKTCRRIVLTGTPLQNNLQEYHCMVNFVKPGLLGTKNEFRNRFVNPIANGQCADSTIHDVKLMKKRVHILHRLLDGCVQRCGYDSLAPYLPPKCEYVISVRLSDVQVSLYRHFLQHLARGGRHPGSQGTSLFWDFNMLRNIWTHPLLLELSAERLAARELLKEQEESDAMDSFIDDGSLSEKSTPDTNNDDGNNNNNDDDDEVVCLDEEEGPSTRATRSMRKNKEDKADESSGDEVISTWKTRSRGNPDEQPPTPPPKPQKREWWDQYVSEEDMEKLQISGKMTLLYNILQECDAIGDKVILFSQSLLTLNMVEKLLEQCDERAALVDPETALVDPKDPWRDCHNTWVAGIDYFRMDGSTSVDLRARWIEMFNDEENPRGRLFLISTKAGSLGTNLVGANRVVLMDASWNPTDDVQAIFRVYRFGQKKPVFIYRLLAQGTMEEKIYDRQVTKQSLSCRVVDEQQIERHFNAADLQELYKFDPDKKSNRPTPMLPKDRLLAELLIRNKDWIVTYHEHDSLLQNVTSEELTEEERKLAWEEYKDEREGKINSLNDVLGIETQGTGQTFRLALDLNQMMADIKAKCPYLTPNQLIDQLKRALFAYRHEFQNRQLKAFEKRAEFLKLKQLVPNEIIAQLTESGLAIQQLNQVLSKLDALGKPQQQQPQQQPQQQQWQQQQQQQQQRAQYYQQQAYMQQQRTYSRVQPQYTQQQQAQYQQQARAAQQQARTRLPEPNEIYIKAYNYAVHRGIAAQMAHEYALTQQKLAYQQYMRQFGATVEPVSVPVISEVDDDTHVAGSSTAAAGAGGTRQPSSSSVVITEVID
ncbi:uncharacterized protein LOC144128303 isoform X2 [Amblyomma americanum]